MKFIKFILKTIVVLVLLMVTAFAGIVLFVDPNDYKDNIVTIVKQKTGRDLALPGELSFSVYPWLGLKLGEASLSNPETFARPTFAKIDSLDIRLSVKQLFNLRPELGILYINGLDVTLIKRANGETNWDDLASDENPSKNTTAAEKPRSDANALLEKLTISAFEIKNARVVWLDETTKTNLELNDFNLETGVIRLAAPTAFDIAFNTVLNDPAISTGVSSKGKLSVKSDFSSFTLNNWDLSLDVEGESIPGEQQEIKLSGNVIYDLNEQLLNLIDIETEVADMSAIVDMKVANLDKEPEAKGQIIVPEFSLGDTLKKLGVDLPEMASQSALDKFELNTDLEFLGDKLNINNFNMTLDDSRFKGNAKVKLSDVTDINYEMILDDIDLDKYLPPETEEAAAPTESAKVDDEPLNLPVDLLKSLKVKGSFSTKSIKVMNLRLREIEAKQVIQNSIAQVKLNIGKVYSGQGELLASIDARGNKPAVSAKGDFDKIQIGNALKDFMDEDFVTGRGSLNFNVRSQAETTGQLTSTLNGVASFDLSDGEIQGINIAEKLRQVEAKKEGVKYERSREVNSTDFAGLSGSGKFSNGRFNFSAFKLEAPLLRASAKGGANIHKELFDMQFDAYFVNTKTGQSGKQLGDVRSLLVPIKIKGSFDEPELSVVWSKFLLQGQQGKVDAAKSSLKQQNDQAKQELQARRDAEKARADQRIQEAKARAKEDAKKRLFDKLR